MALIDDILKSKPFRKGGGRRDKYYEHILRHRVRSVSGLWLEFGVFDGKSLAILHKEAPGVVYGFDSFLGLPESWMTSKGLVTNNKAKYTEGTFKTKLSPEEQKKFLEEKYPRARIIVGLFQDTLAPFLQEHKKEPIAVLHLDADLYSSTAYVLETLEHRIGPGTLIMLDEIRGYKGWEEHEYKAFLEFLERTGFDIKWVAHVSNAGQAACLVL